MHRLNLNGYEPDRHHEAAVAFCIHAGTDELTSPVHQHRKGQLILALIPVLLWICCQSRPMNMLALGEISARQLGLPLWFWRNVLVAATGWMVGVSVALAGAIGFIGLVIPHILRLCGLTDHRVLLPGCALAGESQHHKTSIGPGFLNILQLLILRR